MYLAMDDGILIYVPRVEWNLTIIQLTDKSSLCHLLMNLHFLYLFSRKFIDNARIVIDKYFERFN